LVEHVEQLTFNAARAFAKGQEVLYVTERAVFRLTADGLTLVEVAPGIDVERDIRAHMMCPLRVAPDVRSMEATLFLPTPVGLAKGI
jgi:acyl CoA:acetate/3-ketoacid CoA transferase